jgi:hypothetical protein
LEIGKWRAASWKEKVAKALLNLILARSCPQTLLVLQRLVDVHQRNVNHFHAVMSVERGK